MKGQILVPEDFDTMGAEDVAQLFGRADVEALAGEFVDMGLDPRTGGGEIVGEAAQQLGVDEDAFHLHRGQHLDERYGPSTHVVVSSTPPGLLAEGAGAAGVAGSSIRTSFAWSCSS